MSSNSIEQAVQILKKGGLVAFPTETVYGLGADAKNPEALKKIFAAKQRPIDHPLIVHIAHINQLPEWAREIPTTAFQLADAFWPGPLTLILKKALGVSDLVTGNQDTIGLRIPRHPVAQTLLESFGGGIAAPSANRFGRISPTTAAAVREELGESVDCILEGGECEVGLESTILDLSGESPSILRPGMISPKEIEAILKKPLLRKKEISPRVSGSHAMHYAPKTKLVLIQREKLFSYLEKIKKPVAVLVYGEMSSLRAKRSNPEINSQCITMSSDPKTYAHDLYRVLRELDHQHFNEIVVEAVPQSEEWVAIADRLLRASAK